MKYRLERSRHYNNNPFIGKITMTRMTPNMFFNLDWSGYAKSSDIEKASAKVTGAIERGTEKITGTIDKNLGKVSSEIKQNTDKIAGAVKDGTKDIVDSVKRINTTNAVGSNQNVPLAVKAVQKGLQDVSEATSRIAGHLVTNPSDLGAATQAAESVGKRFSELVKATSQYEEGTSKLNGMVGEMEKCLDWVDYKFSNAACNQGGMMAPPIPVINGAFGGGVFNAAQIAPPVVGNFNDLPGQ
jgi:hypothetical protein